MRSSSGCCPGLGKPLGFQPVFACVSKSLEESLTRISFPCSPCGPWMFLGLLTQEILEEIFLKNGRGPEINQFYYNFKL